jgi:hypothetical protein
MLGSIQEAADLTFCPSFTTVAKNPVSHGNLMVEDVLRFMLERNTEKSWLKVLIWTTASSSPSSSALGLFIVPNICVDGKLESIITGADMDTVEEKLVSLIQNLSNSGGNEIVPQTENNGE